MTVLQKLKGLGKSQLWALRNFLKMIQAGEHIYEDNETVCVRYYANSTAHKLSLFRHEAKAYTPYAIEVVGRLVKRGIFTIEVHENPETKRKVKSICLKKELIPDVQSYLQKRLGEGEKQ